MFALLVIVIGFVALFCLFEAFEEHSSLPGMQLLGLGYIVYCLASGTPLLWFWA
jgi:uncharacterized membrane protein YbhN (UPF0104 family)